MGWRSSARSSLIDSSEQPPSRDLRQLRVGFGTSIITLSCVVIALLVALTMVKPKRLWEAVAIYAFCGEQCQESAGAFTIAREWDDVYAALRTTNGAARLAAFLRKYPEDGVATYHAAFQRQQQPLAELA